MRIDWDKIRRQVQHGVQRVWAVLKPRLEPLLARVKEKLSEAKQNVVPAPVRNQSDPDSLEGRLGRSKVKSLLSMAAGQLVPALLPALKEHRVLELGVTAGRFAGMCKDHGARVVVANNIGGGDLSDEARRDAFAVRSSSLRLPYGDASFDFAVADFLTMQRGDFGASLKELGRVLAPGATLIALDFHPFAEFAKRGNARVKPVDANYRGVGDYHASARLVGLQVQEVREAFIDEMLRPQFVSPEEKQAYRAFRDSPLVIALVARKSVLVS